VVAGYGAPLRAAVLLEVLVVWSLVYLALRRLAELILLCWCSADAKEVEILVLRLWVPESRSWVLSCGFVGEAIRPP
jgi:hypothetical protein